MEIQITAIKFETVNGKKTGKSFSFKADPKFSRLRQPSKRKSRSMWLRVASSREKSWMM